MIDITKPLETRHGDKAVVIQGPDGKLYGYTVDKRDGSVSAMDWLANGHFTESSTGNGALDLVNVPDRRTITAWMNIYDDGEGPGVFTDREQADYDALYGEGAPRIACVEIEVSFEVGQGLEAPAEPAPEAIAA